MLTAVRIQKSLFIAWLGMAVGTALAQNIWLEDDQNNLFTVNPQGGALSFVAKISGAGIDTVNQVTDIAFDKSGQLWGVTFSTLYKINAQTGSAQPVGDLRPNEPSASFNALVFDANGTLYTADRGPNGSLGQLFTVNTATGVATSLNTNPTGQTCTDSHNSVPGVCTTTNPAFVSSGDLAFLNGTLYHSSVVPNFDTLVTLGTAGSSTGMVTSTAGALGQKDVWGLATIGSSLYAAAGKSIYTVNTTTGAMQEQWNYSADGKLGKFNGATYYGEGLASPTPEPSSYAMLLAGLGVMSLLAKRRLPRAVA